MLNRPQSSERDWAPGFSATLSSMPTPAVGGERLPVVVARSVSKSFTVPEEKVHTLKERALHPRRQDPPPHVQGAERHLLCGAAG